MNDDAGQPDDDGFAAVLAEFLTRLDRGEEVCRATFLQEHPQHAAALRDYFADVDVVEQLYPSIPNGAQSLSRPPLGAFGDYDLLNVIGRGGTGIVYRARQRTTNQVVALKMLLHGLLLSPTDVQRFRNETATVAALDHPRIVPMYDAGESKGHLYFTMPLFTGGNLARRIIAGPMSARAAAEMVLMVAEAVEFAHQHGVIHRDLKPANVLLNEQGSPHISDFGLARQLAAGTRDITRTGELLGTPNYMAPEQVMGDHSRVGPAVDIYAIGAVLYALLVGRPPFHSKLITETLQKICSAEPVPPRELNHQVPPALETICLKCLEKSPAGRYRSAAELIADLRRFLAGEQPVARRTSGLELTRRWFVRNPVTGMLVVGICLVLVAGTAFSLYYAQRARHREQLAETNLYAADMNLAQQHLSSGAVGSVLPLLERHRLPTVGKSPPPWEWSYLWSQCRGELRRFEGPKSAVYAAAFSPDGCTVAAAGADRLVWIWETASGKLIHKLEGHTSIIRALAFSPDGKKLVTVADDGLALLWDTHIGKRLAPLAAAGDSTASKVEKPVTASALDAASATRPPLTAVDFSPDGRLIAIAGNAAPKVQIWDAQTLIAVQSLDLGPTERVAFAPDSKLLAIAGRNGQIHVCQWNNDRMWAVHKTFHAHDDVIRDLAWSPDGQYMATGGADRAVAIWDTKTWSQFARIREFKEQIYSVAFSPDGRQLVMAARHEPIKVWDRNEQKVNSELVGHTDLVTMARFCPEGWRIVSASDDGTVRLWDALRPTSHDRLEGHFGHVKSVVYSPAGNMLATGDADNGAVVLWNTATYQPSRVLWPGAVDDLAFSPDGEYLASTSWHEHLHVWDVTSGREIHDLTLQGGKVVGVAWRPDGRQLAVRSINGFVRFFDPKSGVEQTTLVAGHDRDISGNIAYSPNGQLLATTSGGNVTRLWQTSSLSLARELRGHTSTVVNIAFNPQSAVIATSSLDRTIRLWDVATGEHLRTLVGHAGTPFGLAFSPDGTRLVSGSSDRSVKVWDVASGLELQSLVGHMHWARDVAFSPDGQHIAAAGYDGTVRVWHAPSHSLQAPNVSTVREANALVTHLSLQHTDPSSLAAAINNDKTVSADVRAAATQEVEAYVYYWPFVVAGHRAAQRGNWLAAVEAFDRVTRIAPDESIHWHWLAMASIAAGQHDNYQWACSELIRRTSPEDPRFDLWWASRTWCAQPHDAAEIRDFKPLLEAYSRRFSDTQSLLNRLRAGNPPEDIFASDFPFGVNCDDANAWYLFAITYLKSGNRERAHSYYESGNQLARTGLRQWPDEVCDAALRKEFEALLAAQQGTTAGTKSSVTPVRVSPSGEPAVLRPPVAPTPTAAQ